MKKFELTTEKKINRYGRGLYRIRALIAFKTSNGEEINIGDLGGYVESEKNLSHDEKAWVCGNAEVWGNAKVCGDAEVYGGAEVYGDAEVWGNAKVYGDAKVCGNAMVWVNAKVWGNAKVYGNARVYGNTEVWGNAEVYGNAEVWGNVEVYGGAEVYGDAEVRGNAKVLDNAKVWGIAKVWGNAKVLGDAEVYGNAEVWGNAKVWGIAAIFSTEHILNITPIGVREDSVTFFRTKTREIDVAFAWDFYTLDAFERLITNWADKPKATARMAIEIAKFHIDLTSTAPFEGCRNCYKEFNDELVSEYEIKYCPWCGTEIDR